MSKKLRLFKGRSSKGTKGINLSENDDVISLSIIDNTKNVQKFVKKNGSKKEIIKKHLIHFLKHNKILLKKMVEKFRMEMVF